MSVSKEKVARIIRAVQIGGVRLVEANAKTRVRSIREAGDAGVDIKYRAAVTKDAPDEQGRFFVLAQMEAKVSSEADPKSEPMVLVSVTFELKYRLPEGLDASREELNTFAKSNAVHNAWPYFRELIQNATARMDLPPIVIPLHRVSPPQSAAKRIAAGSPSPAKGEAKR